MIGGDLLVTSFVVHLDWQKETPERLLVPGSVKTHEVCFDYSADSVDDEDESSESVSTDSPSIASSEEASSFFVRTTFEA